MDCSECDGLNEEEADAALELVAADQDNRELQYLAADERR